MSDEPQKQPPTNRSIVEGVSAQGFGGALGTLYVLNQASHGIYYPAGYELALGTICGTITYVLYKLFAARVIRWSRKRQ